MTPGQIDAFLFFGYIPVANQDFLNKLAPATRQSPISMRDRVQEGTRVLATVFDSMVAKNRQHVVPISGGLDSRVVLAGLRPRTLAKDLATVTFGTPGTWDYDIGAMVSRQVGCDHEAIDVGAEAGLWRTEDLVRTAATLPRPIWIFDKHINNMVSRRFGRAATYWSGFMGDPLAGSHLLLQPSASWREAQQNFAVVNQRASNLHRPEFIPWEVLPAEPLAEMSRIDIDEQLDFAVRQGGYINQIVIQKDHDYQTPFMHKLWTDYMLAAPRSSRLGQRLYRDVIYSAFPDIFSLPAKNFRGGKLFPSAHEKLLHQASLTIAWAANRIIGRNWIKFKNTNYVDFDALLRSSASFRNLAQENLEDLHRRSAVYWLDPPSLLRRHLTQRENNGQAITLLVSLEVFLKSKNSLCESAT